MAVAHCSVIMRPPKPIVTWTSMENRKAEVKDLKEANKERFLFFLLISSRRFLGNTSYTICLRVKRAIAGKGKPWPVGQNLDLESFISGLANLKKLDD